MQAIESVIVPATTTGPAITQARMKSLTGWTPRPSPAARLSEARSRHLRTARRRDGEPNGPRAATMIWGMRNSGRADSKRLTVTAPAPTIGLLVDCLEDSYQWSVLRGAMDAAYDHGARLLCFVGGVLGAPPWEGGERNGVFDLA